jgi:hypothetical protein
MTLTLTRIQTGTWTLAQSMRSIADEGTLSVGLEDLESTKSCFPVRIVYLSNEVTLLLLYVKS